MKRWILTGSLGLLVGLLGLGWIGAGIVWTARASGERIFWGVPRPGRIGWWGGGPVTGTIPFGGCPMGGGVWTPGQTSISDEEAVRIARAAIAAYGNPDLELAEVMAFDNHFYAQARERSTGRYAFEFLIDRATGAVHPEPGPNMMWNTQYGMGMMGGYTFPSGVMPISPEEARRLAQAYLDQARPRLTVDEEADPFYGYYTLHVLRDGQIVGMLSVNGYTGQVWMHTWHGTFLRMVYGHGEEHGDASPGRVLPLQ